MPRGNQLERFSSNYFLDSETLLTRLYDNANYLAEYILRGKRCQTFRFKKISVS